MALIIGKNAVYAADVLVGNSNKAIRIFYRAPTTKERVAYNAGLLENSGQGQRRGAIVELRQEYGRKIITGVREGDITLQTGAGETDLMQAPDWQDQLLEYAPHIVEAVAEIAYERAAAWAVKEEPEPEKSETGEAGAEPDPLDPAA